MASILFIKTSSLGDVIHHMPALTEARKARPDARFTWLVEEAFAPLVRLHSAVAEVIPVAWRRWRKSLYAPATLSEIAGNLRAIRAPRYDEIVDSQGLLRTAVIARLARGRRHGYDTANIREPLAALFYDVRHSVSRDLHAVERNRILSGLALGYAPQGAPDFGLDRARFVVGVDTGLLHLAAALGVPLVAIFAGSKPGLTGPVGSGPIAVLGAQGTPPTVAAIADAVANIAR